MWLMVNISRNKNLWYNLLFKVTIANSACLQEVRLGGNKKK